MDADLAALATLTDSFFRAVSFDTEHIPAYVRIRALFIEGGKLINNSSDVPEIWSVDGFIASRRRMADSGALTAFEEFETSATTQIFGNLAHRLSTYEKRGTRQGQRFAGSGLISTQLVRTQGGWKMSSMAWDDSAAFSCRS